MRYSFTSAACLIGCPEKEEPSGGASSTEYPKVKGISTPATMDAGRRTFANRLAAAEVKSALAIPGACRSAVAVAGPDNGVWRAIIEFDVAALLPAAAGRALEGGGGTGERGPCPPGL